MIGVLSKDHQREAVEEFFQLFKTPWEPWRREAAYDVVVATTDVVDDVDARLLVLYGAAEKHRDLVDGAVPVARRRGGMLRYRGVSLPAYGELLVFEERGAGATWVEVDGGAAGLHVRGPHGSVVRLGYDLFEEVAFLISTGQPAEHAHIPALDLHVAMLRDWILGSGIALVEIPPAPAGYCAVVCLTHDIDFAGIRPHRLDHTMWGFLYRSTAGAVRDLWRGRLSVRQVLQNWRAAASLPLVYLGWARDFWEPFAWYLRAERGLPATYFLIPFKNRPGERVDAPHARRRAAGYDVGDLGRWTDALLAAGCELGVHGIDAWHAPGKGRAELARLAALSGQSRVGVRMHWLLGDEGTAKALEDAGYAYDSTLGYNETIGYRNGTGQVFRPAGARTLLEVPLHLQDGALFAHDRLDLPAPEAWARCRVLIEHARKFGGVLTVLWHDRSHAPERLWGGFYLRLLGALRSLGAWFATAGQAADWFGARREIRFERSEGARGLVSALGRTAGDAVSPPLAIRVHRESGTPLTSATASAFVDVPWNGVASIDLDLLRRSLGTDVAGVTAW